MDDFDALPAPVQQKIDAAFTRVLRPTSTRHPRRKRRKVEPPPESAGGFLPDEPQDEDQEESLDDTIPFSLIPSALEILGLQPDDEEVLQVFRNAASGWNNAAQSTSSSVDEGMILRKDWRAVCSVLMIVEDEEEHEQSPPINQSVMGGGFLVEDGEDEALRGSPLSDIGYGEDEENDDEEEDAYEESSLSSLEYDEDSDDEYLENSGTPKGKGRNKTKDKHSRSGKRTREGSVESEPGTPTPEQREAILKTFALFFTSPSDSEAELIKRRLTFKDIHRVSDLLKQNMKSDDVTEMMAFFSTSPDKTVSFDDFTRMMLMAKLA